MRVDSIEAAFAGTLFQKIREKAFLTVGPIVATLLLKSESWLTCLEGRNTLTLIVSYQQNSTPTHPQPCRLLSSGVRGHKVHSHESV
jgi:hypothetical protein